MTLTPVQANALNAIKQASAKYKVDWRPIAAIDNYESGLNPNAVGDNNSSFGIDQEHVGGALPSGLNPAQIRNVQRQAEFQARQVAALGIQGLKPYQQTFQISKRYERPTDVAKETQAANAWLRSTLPGLGALPAPTPLGKPKDGAATIPSALNTPTAPTSRYSAQDIAALQGLLGQRQASQQSAQDALGAISGDAKGVANPIDLTPYLDRGQPPAGRPTPAKPPAAPPTKPAPTTPTRTKGGYTVGTFEGTKVASWMVPALAYARANGWTGKVLSGLRSTALQAQLYAKYQAGGNIAAKPGQSNHEIQNGGAFDASDPTQLNKILAGYKGQRPIYAPTVGLNDSAHFSVNGH